MNKANHENILFLGNENSPLLKWLRLNGESVIQTTQPFDSNFIDDKNIKFLVSYGFRHIIPKNILDQFPNRAINLHISLLPWNKGADPNLWSFIDGTPKGVTIHYLDAGIDTGDVIVQKEVLFDIQQETLSTSYQTLQSTIELLFQQNWQSIKNESCARQPQQHPGSLHKLKDKETISHLLTQGWDTPISRLQKNIDQTNIHE